MAVATARRVGRVAMALGLLVGIPPWQKVVRAQSPLDGSLAPRVDTGAFIPPPVVREFRAAWVSPVDEPDWPSRPGLSVEDQQTELRALLDEAQDLGLNAIIFHVRTAGDALYDTPLAPWSAALSGEQGRGPGYDPLAFAILEAHARGLQLHAWFNPFRARLGNGPLAAGQVVRTRPDWIRRYGTQTWIDPGDPNARAAVLATIVDVVKRYDVDGIHLDDYFYPYRETETRIRHVGRGRHRHRVRVRRELPFPDAKTWRRYGVAKGWTSRAAWRRHNIDEFVETLYTAVHRVKPWMVVGISPFGIWRPGAPPGITGLDAYEEIYADSRRWLRSGWVDYLAPQLYWPLDDAEDRFRKLDAWWRLQNPHHRWLWPGLFTGRIVGEHPWPPDEIGLEIAQLRLARAGTGEANGHIHFRLGTFRGLAAGEDERVLAGSYRTPAVVPAFPWLGGAPPAPPVVGLPDGAAHNGHELIVSAGDTTPVAWWLLQTHRLGGDWDLSIIRATDDRIDLDDDYQDGESLDAVAMTALDRVGQASTPTLVFLRSGAVPAP